MTGTSVSGVDGRDFRVTSASSAFLDYAERELERRQNSGDPFDEALYREAVTLVRGYLEAAEKE